MLVAVLFTAATSLKAQVSLNVNIGAQPLWGPTGYNQANYYYLPDINSYYNVPKQQFVYLRGNNWVFTNTLPATYRNYDLYRGYKVVLNEDRPYLNYKMHAAKYGKFKNYRGQQITIKQEKYKQKNNKPMGNHGKGKGNKH